MKKLNKKLTKTDIVERLYMRLNEKKISIYQCVSALIEEMEDALSKGHSVELRGLGTFELHFREGRKNTRNPKTEERIHVCDRYVPFFRPGKKLKAAVKEYKEPSNF